jgi:peptidoglycan/xylan/chitin deacetylase (PgdA/CDA1 family)
MKPALALKVDVDTLRGSREGVPRLARLLAASGVRATFLFSVGPDRTGRAIRRIFRRGFLSKVSRTSVLEHYGLRTLLYGTVLPGPHIGRSCARELRAVRDEGFEVGLHAYDHVKWQDFVSSRGAEWTASEMRQGFEAFQEVFDEAPRVHGAAGWQMNPHAFALEDEFAFDYASDTRGTHPYRPIVEGRLLRCVQVPTTLPTLDELIGVRGFVPTTAARHILELTEEAPSSGHVFTLHAELEGMRLLPILRELIEGWIGQGYDLVSLRALHARIKVDDLRIHSVVSGSIAGRSGAVVMQGPEMLIGRAA